MKIKEIPCKVAPSRGRKDSEKFVRKDLSKRIDQILDEILNGKPRN